jgi:tRNA threonylcarbamoyladenosine biosynthesis protein TsaB
MNVAEGHPRIVAIETTGRQGSVAIASGDELLAMTQFATDLRHAVDLLPAINRLCMACDWRPETIDELYVSAGPGSFTGCRIGITVARAMALALGIRLVRAPTVDVLARNVAECPEPPEHLLVLLDAQRRQVYAAVFHAENGGYTRDGDVRVGEPATLLSEVPKPCAVLGEGISYHRNAIDEMGFDILPEWLWSARAENVLRVGRQLAGRGEYVAAGDLVPIYIRLPEAEEKWRLRHNEAVC